MLLKDEETAIESGRDWPLIALFSRSVVRERLVLEKRWQLHVPSPSSRVMIQCHNLNLTTDRL